MCLINYLSIGSGTGTVLKESIWHRYQKKKKKRYQTLVSMAPNYLIVLINYFR